MTKLNNLIDEETKAEIHFQTESGRRQSDRLVEDCFVGLISLLHDQFVQIDGKQYQMKVISKPDDDKIMFDIRDLPGFDHIEFVIKKTGWGRGI